jgi:hypothetical protein
VTKVIAPLLAALFMVSPALADDCYFTHDAETLRFDSPTELAVSGAADYSCSTSSGGAGVVERVAHCSDGYEGSVAFNEDETVTFRDAVWEPTCPDESAVLDLMN